jgi:DUF1009 family protein
MLEEFGLRAVGAHELAPEILMPQGKLGRLAPTPRDDEDIAYALALIAATGPFDVGQAVVVAHGWVLAVEAAEGTDHMLDRVSQMRREGRIRLPDRVGVLVKAPKLGQDLRFDLPSIGARTIERAAAAGLAGVAVEAGGAITVDLEQLVRTADDAGLFVIGIRNSGPGEGR